MDVLSSFSPCLQSSRIQLPPRHVSHVHHVTEMALPPSCRKLQEIRNPATKLNLHFNYICVLKQCTLLLVHSSTV